MDILSVVPQLFYDLIARVLPSSVIFILFHLNFPNTIKGDPEKWSFFLVGLAMAYFLSFFFQQISKNTIGRIRKESRQKNLNKQRIAAYEQFNRLRVSLGEKEIDEPILSGNYQLLFRHLDTDKKKKDPIRLPALHTIHDHLRIRFPREGYRILKLQAEFDMLLTAAGGLVFLVGLNLLTILNYSRGDYFEFIVFLMTYLILLPMIYFRAHRKKEITYFSTTLAWLTISYPIKNQDIPDLATKPKKK